ncbi:insulinase family protein [Candidatus Parcubacteria bacterium]|nr:insulinase family protein [Candidatus Parcubacteria bacterium]
MQLTKLKNDLKLITAPMSGTKTITVLVMVGTGSKYEDKKNSGVSHFLEHMFFKGAKKWKNTLAISSEMDGIGADFNAFTSKEYTGYWIKTEQSKLELVLDLLSDMYFNSKLDAKEIECERGVIIEEFNMYLDNPMMHIEDVFENLLYGDTPAGRDTIGTKETILGVQKKDFVDYFNSQYNVNNTTVCLAGDIKDNKKAENLVNKYFNSKIFEKRGKNFIEKSKVIENQKIPQIKMEYKKTDQAHLSLGVRAYSYDDNDRVITRMLSLILGGSMSSRLFINLRERNGLAYYVRTSSEAYTDTGYLTTSAGVPVDKIDKAIKIILDEYKKIKNSLVSPKELKRAKDLLKGKFAIQMEVSDNLANWYSRQAVLENTILRVKNKDLKQKNLLSPDQYLKNINKITAVDIQKVAKDIFVNEGLNLAVIGSFKDKNKFKRLLKV